MGPEVLEKNCALRRFFALPGTSVIMFSKPPCGADDRFPSSAGRVKKRLCRVRQTTKDDGLPHVRSVYQFDAKLDAPRVAASRGDRTEGGAVLVGSRRGEERMIQRVEKLAADLHLDLFVDVRPIGA